MICPCQQPDKFHIKLPHNDLNRSRPKHANNEPKIIKQKIYNIFLIDGRQIIILFTYLSRSVTCL